MTVKKTIIVSVLLGLVGLAAHHYSVKQAKIKTCETLLSNMVPPFVQSYCTIKNGKIKLNVVGPNGETLTLDAETGQVE